MIWLGILIGTALGASAVVVIDRVLERELWREIAGEKRENAA